MKTKIITGMVLALCLASMLSIMPASAVVTKPGAVFKGKVTWAFGENAWGKVYIYIWGDYARAIAWFYVPEFKEFYKMKFVEVDEIWIGEYGMIFDGWWDVYVNGEFDGTHLFAGDFFPDEFEFWNTDEIGGSTILFKTWGL